MEKISIENNRETIESIIARIVTEYAKNDKVHAIYMNSFQKWKEGQNKEPIIEIALVHDKPLSKKEIINFDKQIKEIYDETGIIINIGGRLTAYYNYYLLDMKDKLAAQELQNGYLLYDKTGSFSELKNYLIYRNTEVLLPNYLNAIEFEPPLRLKKIKQNSK